MFHMFKAPMATKLQVLPKEGMDNTKQGKPLVELPWVSSAWAQSSSCTNHEQGQRKIQSCGVSQQGTDNQVTHAALHQFYCWKEREVLLKFQAPLTKIHMKQQQFFQGDKDLGKIWEPDFPPLRN